MDPPVVLVCPLDWGLGHASRCIPLVEELLGQGCRVVVGAWGGGMKLLQEEFGQRISYIDFPGRVVRYPRNGNMALSMFLQAPSLALASWREHRQLGRLLKQTGARVVISDNRFGLWSKKCMSVFITHQVFIQAPGRLKWLEPMLFALNRFFMNRYQLCWVPDLPGDENLSGILSHKRKIRHLRFIGPLTRFGNQNIPRLPENSPPVPLHYYLVILSGPEPQRSILEQELIRQFDLMGGDVVFVRGMPGEAPGQGRPGRIMLSHAGTSLMHHLIANARAVICRPGYSTLMDMSVFGKKALLIPTPGQTEQEYLGEMLHQKQYAHCTTQDRLILADDLQQALQKKGIPGISHEADLLREAVNELLQASVSFGHR